MSNTVITNFCDASGPRSSADSPYVVVLERDGTISLDQEALDNLVSGDASQSTGISVVRVAQEGRPDDATDSENEDDSIPHVTVTVDGYHDDPNGIAKYESGIEMLQSLSNETREHSLIGFQNDHCYTPLTSSSQSLESESVADISYDENVQAKSFIPSSKKITILEQQIIPKGKKIVFNPIKEPVILKGPDVLNKPLPLKPKLTKKVSQNEIKKQNEESKSSSDKTESSGGSLSGESINDRDSDADYKYARDGLPSKAKKPKSVLRTMKKPTKTLLNTKPMPKILAKSKPAKSLLRQEFKNKILEKKKLIESVKRTQPSILSKRKSLAPAPVAAPPVQEPPKAETPKPKILKKEKKTPAHVSALLSDMTTLFSTPDVIRTVSSDGKRKAKNKDVEGIGGDKSTPKTGRVYGKNRNVTEAEGMLQIDDASLARLLQEPNATEPSAGLATTTANPLSSPNIGPLSPTLDLLASLQPEEEGLTEDLLLHVAQLVESSENLQEVIDKQVLGKVDTGVAKTSAISTPVASQSYAQAQASAKMKILPSPRKDPIQIVRSDGRVITLPPIEAPATRSSKRRSQGPVQTEPEPEVEQAPIPVESPAPVVTTPKTYSNKKLPVKKTEPPPPPLPAPEPPPVEVAPEQPVEENITSEDDPYRLWCICKQPHNNRFMICCDRCEDWFHGKCVNITKAMGQQMEEQGVEWTCPNCITKIQAKANKSPSTKKSMESDKSRTPSGGTPRRASETPAPGCIVCGKAARAGSIYCGNSCILKHAQESLGSPTNKSDEKTESRIIVFERKTGRVLQGANAPTAENLKTWLQQHPTFEVVRRERENKPVVNVVKKPTHKIQTTLKIDKQQKQIILLQPQPKRPQPETTKKPKSVPPSPQEDPKTPTNKQNQRPVQLKQTLLVNKDGTLSARAGPKQSPQGGRQGTPTQKAVAAATKPETKNTPARITLNRSQSTHEKNVKSPPTPVTRTRREREPEPKPKKPESTEPMREKVRSSLQEQMSLRLAETKGVSFTEEEIKQFAVDTELEMHSLFKEVSMKYKSKYRSLIFNIKDRKNLSLWQKICDRTLTPKKLVHMSAEELASQELAQWRDKEAKHQLELIKKSELDLLTASKTYVLKTHKGEEVMEQKSVSAEVDPNVAVEDLVTALNDTAPPQHDKEKHKHSRQKDSHRKSPEDAHTRSSSRHKSSKEERSKAKKKASKEEKAEERKSRRERRRSRDRSREKEKRHRSRSRRRRGSDAKASKRRSRSGQRSARSLSQDHLSKDKISVKEDVERPKSALQKETHPEYDPHEPMITSAFSEEDVRRSREASFDEGVLDAEYDPANTLSFDAIAPSLPGSSRTHRLPSEAESDQEPSSTCDSPPVWSGLVNMVDVARFYVSAHQVSGNCTGLEEDVSSELDIVGRINPTTVWDYISQMQKMGNKDIIVLKLTSSPLATVEERMQYIALFSYLSSRNRLGVVKVTNTSVKDFYIFPLAAHESLPSVLLPLDGPGLDETRTHLLFALIVRLKKKRSAGTSLEAPAPKVSKRLRKRSYTPPLPGDSYTPPSSPAPAPARRAAPLRLPLPFVPPSAALSSSVKDKIAASLANADDDEPYSPGGSSSGGEGGGGGGDALRGRVDEINRQIEEQKQQILSIAVAVQPTQEEDEAYSPTRPLTPPRPALADIALPSNLHEILANIQQRSQPPPPPPPASDVDMRVPPASAGTLHALSEEELLRMVPDDAK